jgi:hypothetical protein
MSWAYPYHIGRFEKLFEACDEIGIMRPTTLITESGWGHDDMPSVNPAMADVKWLSKLLAPYPNILGAALWTLEGSTTLPNKLQRLIEPVKTLALETRYPDPEPPPEETIGTVVYFLKPTDLTAEETLIVDGWAKDGYELPDGSKTFGFHTEAFSHTDAIRNVAAGDDESLLLVVAGSRIGDGLDQEWLDENAPEVADRAVFIEFPTPPPSPGLGDPKIGLHASTTANISENEYQEFRDLQPGYITVMSGMHDPNDINRLAGEHPDAEIVVRIFYEFGGRVISPQQFVDDNLNELRRVLNLIGYRNPVVQIHNEPNLYAEGLGSSWQDGIDFNVWYLTVLNLFRQHFPYIQYGFPGLSPGGDIPGVRLNSDVFLRQCSDAVSASQVLCVHTYFAPQAGASLSDSLNEVAAISNLFPVKDIIITECANNKDGVSPEMKAVEYAVFLGMLKTVPKVLGITYFVASTITPEWNWDPGVGTGQSWVPVGMGSRVRLSLDKLQAGNVK